MKSGRTSNIVFRFSFFTFHFSLKSLLSALFEIKINQHPVFKVFQRGEIKMKFARMLASICFVFCLAQAFYAANYTVTKIADTNDGVCDADCSLREAVAAANAAATNDAIYFALPLFASAQTITLTTGELVVINNGTLTIYGT